MVLLAYIEIVIHMKSIFSNVRNTLSNSVIINGNKINLLCGLISNTTFHFLIIGSCATKKGFHVF